MRRKETSNKEKRSWGFLILLLAMGLVGVLTWYFALHARPSIRSAMEYQCRALATQAVQQTVLAAMEEQPQLFERLYSTQKAENGKIQAIYPNIGAINQMKLVLSTELEEQLEENRNRVHSIPLGTLLGLQLLSELPPSFDMRILQQSYVVADVTTELKTAGVNQTEFLIYVHFEILMSATVGGYASPITINESFPVVQLVIMGEVPNYFSAR